MENVWSFKPYSKVSRRFGTPNSRGGNSFENGGTHFFAPFHTSTYVCGSVLEIPTHSPNPLSISCINFDVSPMLRCTMRNRVNCNWPCNWVFELQWPLATLLQLSVFLWHECSHKSCKNCNRHNSSYVESYMYATHAIRL